ncbi:MAG: hypothetical protein ACREUW_13700 [Burkholderiales bacterium]
MNAQGFGATPRQRLRAIVAIGVTALLFSPAAGAGRASLPPHAAAAPLPPLQYALAGSMEPWLLADSKPRSAPAPRNTGNPSAAKAASVTPPAEPLPERARASVVTVTGTGPGQAGTVHYFLIKRPNGTLESGVGIEMPDQRIAWSFPKLGVVVTPFIKSGVLTVRGKPFDLQHLYGLRPFPDDASMRRLQYELESRVMVFADDGTPHCDPETRGKVFCVSCLGFVLRVLFPGRSPGYPGLPPDFERANANAYSTEDLLLYLSGLHGISDEARLRRIDEINPPLALREELLRLTGVTDAATTAGKTESPGAAGKGRPNAGRIGTRPMQRKKL